MHRYQCENCNLHWPITTKGRVHCCERQQVVTTNIALLQIATPSDRQLTDWQTRRLAVCQSNECGRCIDGMHCQELIRKTGRRGFLMHPDGIPKPAARCPLGFWGPVE